MSVPRNALALGLYISFVCAFMYIYCVCVCARMVMYIESNDLELISHLVTSGLIKKKVLQVSFLKLDYS